MQDTPSSSRTVNVLYEDDSFVVFDKPAGLLVIPTEKNEKNTLIDVANRQYASADWKLHPCHRLDRETTGAIIFAKGKGVQQKMMNLFQARQVKKIYIAFLQGKLKHHQGELRSAIRSFDDIKLGKKTPAQMSVTKYRLLRQARLFSVVEAEPVTGRTNQIRIQFKEIGHPLLGDRKYSFGKNFVLKFKRTALHALHIRWKHPVTHKDVNVHSPLPDDMEEFLSAHGIVLGV
jgi:23S rRNA pseudouridine1911/1915/1917 synthase